MAEQQVSVPKKEASGAGGVILSGALLIGGLMLGPMLLVMGQMNAAGPNPGGAQAGTETISPAPGSPVEGLLGDLNRFSDTQQYLQKSSSFLSDTEAKITLLSQRVKEAQPPFDQITAENRKSILETVIPELLSQISLIRTAVAEAKTTEAMAVQRRFVDNLNRLNRLAYGGNAAASAIAIVELNNDGRGPIRYNCEGCRGAHGLSRIIGPHGYPTFMDCSSFISVALQRAGIFKPGQRETTATFLSAARNGRSGLSIAHDTSAPITSSVAAQMISSGQLLPGDMLIKFGTSNHIVMYTGQSGDRALAHSTTTRGKVGPQFSTLNYLTEKRNYKVVIRPPSK
jgi:hypothetical protein